LRREEQDVPKTTDPTPTEPTGSKPTRVPLGMVDVGSVPDEEWEDFRDRLYDSFISQMEAIEAKRRAGRPSS